MRLTRGEGTLNNTIHSMYAEFDVMLHYFKSSGLARYTKNLTEMVSTKVIFIYSLDASR